MKMKEFGPPGGGGGGASLAPPLRSANARYNILYNFSVNICNYIHNFLN